MLYATSYGVSMSHWSTVLFLTLLLLACQESDHSAVLGNGAIMDNQFVRTRPLVIAHRGFSWRAPENTLASYRLAMEVGAEMAECDVYLSKDGVPVLIHDATLTRTTNGTGNVKAFTVAELQAFDAGAWKGKEFVGERIPTLEEVLALVKGHMRLVIEIKEPNIEQEVVNTIKKAGVLPGEVMIFSFHRSAVEKITQIEPGLPSLWLLSHLPGKKGQRAELLAQAIQIRASAVGLAKKRVDAAFVQMAHERGLPVYVYTVNEEKDMRMLAKMGVDGLISDRPDLLLKVLGK
jgi:glycerophosphoryl diester phosphodiesterase